MNLRNLEALRAFVESRSLTEAAGRLRRTQPQISRLLSALEEEVGFPLFTRRSRRLTLTPEGQAFYAQVERMLMSHDELSKLAGRIKSSRHDHVRILIAPHVTDALIADAIPQMMQLAPSFTASIDSRIRTDIEQWVSHEQFDLGISVLPIDNPLIETEEFIAVPAVAVMTEDHALAGLPAVSITDLDGVSLVATGPRSVLRQRLDRALLKARVEPIIRFETPSGMVACQLAARGIGVAVADPFVAYALNRPGIVIRPFLPKIEVQYCFIYPTWQTKSAATQQLAGIIRKLAHERLNYFIE
jgi:DNA-binding transcriptional LysR family regulator